MFPRPPTIYEIVNSLVAAVACRFMQDRHAGRYLGSERVTILVGHGTARAMSTADAPLCNHWTGSNRELLPD